MSGLDSRSAWHRRQEQLWFHIHLHTQMCFQTLDPRVQLYSLRFYLLISQTAEKSYFVPRVMKCPSPKESFSHFSYPATSPTAKSWIMSLSPQPPYSLASNKLSLCSVSTWSFYQFQERKETSLGHRKKLAQMTFFSLNNGKYIVDFLHISKPLNEFWLFSLSGTTLKPHADHHGPALIIYPQSKQASPCPLMPLSWDATQGSRLIPWTFCSSPLSFPLPDNVYSDPVLCLLFNDQSPVICYQLDFL